MTTQTETRRTWTSKTGQTFILITAKFASRCYRCGEVLPKGTRVWWASGVGSRCAVEPKECDARAATYRETQREAQIAKRVAKLPDARPATDGRCQMWTRDQGCPLHGETCR